MIDLSLYENALFDVDEKIIALNSDGVVGSEFEGEQTGYKMLVRSDTNEPISVMSTDYKLVTNKELLEAALPLIDQYGGVVPEPNINKELEISRVFGNARSMFAFDFPNHTVEIANNDILHPRITLINSYDGSKRVGFRYGAYRLVCSNGMTVGSYQQEQFLHLNSTAQLDNLGDLVKNVFENMESAVEGFRSMTEQKLSMKDVNNFVKLFPQRMRGEVYGQLKSGNAWDVYNAGTYVTTHLMDRNAESTHKLERDIVRYVERKAA